MVIKFAKTGHTNSGCMSSDGTSKNYCIMVQDVEHPGQIIQIISEICNARNFGWISKKALSKNLNQIKELWPDAEVLIGEQCFGTGPGTVSSSHYRAA